MKYAICLLIGVLLGGVSTYLFFYHKNKVPCNSGSSQRYIAMLNQWLILKQNNMKIADYLNKRKLKKIAVYGMGVYGRHLVRELQGTDGLVCYGIDRKSMKPYRNVQVKNLQDTLEPVDAVINTVICEHGSIEKQLAPKMKGSILSLEEIVFESYTSYKADEEAEEC